LLACGLAFRDGDPHRARGALRRGLVIAQDSGTSVIGTHLASALALLETNSGDPLAALEHWAVAIRNYHDSGNTANIRPALCGLAVCLDRLGRYEPAATIAGFAFDPLSAEWVPESSTGIGHLRDVLGDETYQSLARQGEAMSTAQIVLYAYDQIDQARAELDGVSK
jgi:tetratricopeptide (TPR) repeat protein